LPERLAVIAEDLLKGRFIDAEDVSEVLVCYALRVYESQRNPQPNRVTP
jgi:hypothetical protein